MSMTDAMTAMYAAAGKYKGASKTFGPMLADACRLASDTTTIDELFKAIRKLVKSGKLEAKVDGYEGRFSYRRSEPSKYDEERHPESERLAALPKKPVLRRTLTRSTKPNGGTTMLHFNDETSTTATASASSKHVAKKVTKKAKVAAKVTRIPEGRTGKTLAKQNKAAKKTSKRTGPSKSQIIRDLFAKKNKVTVAELSKATGYDNHVVHTALHILRDSRRTKADRLLVTSYDRETQTFTLLKGKAADAVAAEVLKPKRTGGADKKAAKGTTAKKAVAKKSKK